MADRVQFTSMSIAEAVERLRIHGRLFMAYAMALAQRAGLSPAEAADLFMRPLLADAAPIEDAGTADEMQRWLQLEAAAMEAVHGEATLERAGMAWTMTINVAADLAWLQPWNASAEYWAAWLEEHFERVAARHGAVVTASLEDSELRLIFMPRV